MRPCQQAMIGWLARGDDAIIVLIALDFPCQRAAEATDERSAAVAMRALAC